MSTESITGAELRAAIDRLGWYVQHEPGIPSSTHPADRIIRDVERHREPEYEPGGVYQDADGDVFKYCNELAGDTPWLGFTGELYAHGHVSQPLRKLVPESPAAPAAGDGPQEIVRPGEMYEDETGQRYYRMFDDGWLMLPDGIRPGDDRHPAYPLRRLVPEGSPLAGSERDLIRRDLGQLLDLLGLGDHARPASSHEVFAMRLEEVAKLAGDQKQEAGNG